MRQTVLRKGPELRRKVLLSVVFIIPLFFLRTAYDVFNVPKLSLLMVGVTIVVAIHVVELLQGRERSGLRLLVVPACALLVPLATATVLSSYRVWTLFGDHSRLTGLVPYAVIILLGILVGDAFRGDVRPIAWALVASAAVAGAYAIIQVAGLDPIEWSATGEATSTIGNTNFSGAFFAMCLPVAAGLFSAAPERRLHLVPLTLCVVAGWLLARSELAWAAGVAGLLALSGTMFVSRWRWARVAGLLGAAMLAISAVAFVLLAMAEESPNFIPGTIERRAEWWGASSRMAADSPLFGSGPNSFALEHTQYRDVDDVVAVAFDVTDDPHSVPLSFLTGAGIVGMLGFVAFAWWVVRSVLHTQPTNVLGIAFGSAAVVYLVQSLLSVDVVTLRFTAWTAVGGMAAALSAPSTDPNKHPFGKKQRRKSGKQAAEPLKALPGVVGVVLAGSLAIAWAAGFLSADLSFRRGLSLAAAGAPGAQEALRSATEFRDSNIIYRTDYGNLVGGNAVAEGLSEDGDPEVAEALMSEAEEAFAFIDRLPRSNSVVAYARLMRDWAQVDPSAEQRTLELYDYAAKLDPSNFLILEEAAGVADAFGRMDRAEQFAIEATRIRESAE